MPLPFVALSFIVVYMMNSKHNPMTGDQKQALRMMAERNIGAMVTRFGWTWPETVRNNDEAAGEVIRILSCK